MECHTNVELSMFFVSTIVVSSILHTLPVHHCYIKTLECLLNLIFHIKCSIICRRFLNLLHRLTLCNLFYAVSFLHYLNLYVLQDPSIPKLNFIMKGKTIKFIRTIFYYLIWEYMYTIASLNSCIKYMWTILYN